MNKNQRTLKATANAGFTLVETLILVAVLAIVVGMAVEPFNEFIDNHRTRLEQADMLEVQTALERLYEEYNRLPSEDPDDNDFCGRNEVEWYDCLAQFSFLSGENIQMDTWGRERRYIMYSTQMEYMGELLPVFYATVHSRGVDLQAEAVAGTATEDGGGSRDIFSDEAAADWWKNQLTDAARITAFEELQPGGDDLQLRYSTTLKTLEKYNNTQERLEQIGIALAAYSEGKRQRQVVIGNPDADRLVYYPPSQETADPTNAANFGPTVMGDIDNTRIANGGWGAGDPIANQNATQALKQLRLASMVTLMRILGLPDEYCCSDLVKDETINGDYRQGRPFYYYANPRLDSAGGACQARRQAVPFVPARVTAEPTVCE